MADKPTRTGQQRLGETAAEWSASRWVNVRGRSVRYRSAGRGTPVVLVHGLGVSADYWVRNAAVIAAAGYRVLAPDLPGFGRTRGPAGGLDVAAQVKAIEAWSDALDLGPAVFLGHSLSCQVIMQMAAEDPARVLGLILAAPTGDNATVRRLINQGLGLLRDLRREPAKLAVLVAEAYLRAGPMRVLRTWRMGARHDPIALLPQIHLPGLVIIGEKDPVVESDFATELADGIGGREVVVIPNGSHGLIFDQTGTFNAAVINFLEEIL